MAVTVGRTHRLAQWNAYDWATSYRYTTPGWGAVTPVGQAKAVAFTVAGMPGGGNTATDKHQVLWGRRSGQGYECASRIHLGTATTFTLTDLLPATTYYGIRVWRYADGSMARGAEFTFNTI